MPKRHLFTPPPRLPTFLQPLLPRGHARSFPWCRGSWTSRIARQLASIPLKVVGDGPERPRLERAAAAVPGSVTFLGRQPDAAIRDLYRGATVTLLPGEEDFGIVPVEAQACGTPVVALNRGGAVETVVPGTTGLLVDEPSAPAFAEAIRARAERRSTPAAIRAHAGSSRRERFVTRVGADRDASNRHAEALQPLSSRSMWRPTPCSASASSSPIPSGSIPD
jgi:glycosyltransferase involved in cell wall biosynthesis